MMVINGDSGRIWDGRNGLNRKGTPNFVGFLWQPPAADAEGYSGCILDRENRLNRNGTTHFVGVFVGNLIKKSGLFRVDFRFIRKAKIEKGRSPLDISGAD